MERYRRWMLVSVVSTAMLAACASKPPDTTTGDRGDGARAAMTDALLETGRIGTDDCGSAGQAQIAFMDSDVFDQNLAWYTRRGHTPIVLIGFDNRKPEDVPPRVMRWLWELKDHDGKVVTRTETEGVASRAFGLSWILQIVSLGAGEVSAAFKEAQKFGGLYHYDAEVVALQKFTGSEEKPQRTLKEIRLVCRPGVDPAAPPAQLPERPQG